MMAMGILFAGSPAVCVQATGKAVVVEDNQSTKGPKMEDVSLQETYYSEYEIYSEGIAGQFFFYTNVPNNGITNQSVSIDIPANIYYTVQKDGIDIAYASKQTLSKMGTYVFRMTVVKNPEAPVSEQIVYNATYNFRIQPKPHKQENDSEYESVEENIEEFISELPISQIVEETQIVETQTEEIQEVLSQEVQTDITSKLSYDLNTGNYIQYFEDGYYLECSVFHSFYRIL